MARILIVEDELQMRKGLQDNLEYEGYQVDFAEDGISGQQKILENPYDLILLDVMLPGKSGLDICKDVRARGITCPILMLTAKGEEIDRVVGLELGADDYITKPFGLRELLARIKAALRRSGGNIKEGALITMGNLQINFSTYEAYRDNRNMDMTHKEFEILKFLWQHKNETVSRDQLLSQVWGFESSTTTRTVDNFILKLRQKIEADPANPKHILTVHGIGYKYLD